MTISGTNNRTYGLSGSGIDVDAQVEALMKAARKPYEKMQGDQTVLGWKKEDYNTMYTSINDFNNNKVSNFQLQSNSAPKIVTSSNTSVLTVTANADAANVNHSIKVTQLASGVTESSSAPITTGSSKMTLNSQFGLSGNFTMKINGKDIEVKSSQSINDLVSTINKSGAGVTANYDTTSDRFYLYTNSTGASTGIDFTGSSSQGLSFVSNNLKISAYTGIDNLGITSGGIGIDDTASLASQFSTLSSNSFNLKISDGTTSKTINVNPTTTSIKDLVSQINGIKNAGGTQMATASFVNGKFSLKSNDVAAPLDLSGSDTSAFGFLNTQLKLTAVTAATPTVNSAGVSATIGFDQTAKLNTQFTGISDSFELKVSDGTTTSTIAINTATMSLDDVITKINAITDGGTPAKQLATASFQNGKLTIKSNSSDNTVDLSSSDTAGMDFLNTRLKLTNKQGQDAKFKLDGVNMTQTSNAFTVSNVKYNLQSTGTSTIGVQTDTDKIVSNLKTFIEDYNKQLSAIYSKVNEKRYKDYAPLTDDQKAAMKDSDVTLWTTKAKSGMLYNDPTLKTLGESMRDIFSRPVSGVGNKYNSAASIGITSSNDWTENGKLYIDEDKLKSVLKEDPNAVYKLFGTSSSSTSSQGLAVQLSGVLKTASAQIVKEGGVSSSTTNDVTSTIGRQYKEYTTQLSAMNTRLISKENSYYNQFNAMESALSKLTQQSKSLASMLG